MGGDDARSSQTPSFFLLLFSFLALSLHSRAQPAGLDSYYCSADRTIYPCEAYILYRAGVGNRSPLDLASVGDLFNVSRLTVARASNLSVSTTLRPGQPLLIPLSCSCAASKRSFSPIAYQITDEDNFFVLSNSQFQNLTSYSFIELLNPSLDPANLAVGTPVTIPIFCQCLNGSSNGVVTSVFQPNDTYSSVASNFGTNVESLVSLNGCEVRIWPYSTILVPLAQTPPPLLANASGLALPPSPPPSSPPALGKEKRKGLIVGLSVGICIMGILFVLALLLFTWFRRRCIGERRKETVKSKLRRKNSKRFARTATNKKLMADISEWLDKYKVYEIEELRRGTADFDGSRLIRGSVYKGILDGKVFAVKRMKWNVSDELKILQKVNHTNLVKLEGFCMDLEAGTCYLVYEYAENGSLHSWLHDPTTSSRLDWRSRLRIALDLAHGLQYIHEHATPCVVHKDIKSSNVLLDSKLRAKIANFGLAKSGCNVVTTHIVGTQGYIAPEYLADGLVSTKMDVYACGVVLLELVSGKEAMSEEGEALWAKAEGVFERREEGMVAWMDPALVGQCCPMESVVSVMNVAMACLQRDPARRPSIGDVAYTLSKAAELLPDCSGDQLSGGSGDMMTR